MGEIADMMLDGTLCNCCGVHIDLAGGEVGYDSYAIQLQNTILPIRKEDLEPLIDDEEPDAINYLPYGQPLFCEDDMQAYMKDTKVFEVKQRVVMLTTLVVRGRDEEDAQFNAQIAHNAIVSNSESEDLQFVSAQIENTELSKDQKPNIEDDKGTDTIA